ncbi:MAG: hypothetical protein KME19_24855 [Microcoleus vaginatus WJT46-NPBG5]|nr:hypothetical protein [Microcoleus vaginatus WJT46-NPBG5]
MKLHEQNVFDKRFAERIGMMIKSRLIWYKHYYRWADEIIMAMDRPPYWVLEIATIKYFPKAVGVINEFVCSEPFEYFNGEEYTDEYVACLFLRYKRGEIGWATFLNEAGLFTDADNGHRYCEYFYHRLNILEDNEYSKVIQQSQRVEIEHEYGEAIARIQELDDGFLEYFRQYVRSEAQQHSE